MPPLYIPKVIGHRGAKAYAPENTLSSLHAAADMGIEWVEIDVKLSKDGEAIVFHDDDLMRCTGVEGLVAETDFKTLRTLDAGSYFGDSFIGEKIPTLEEALEVILERGMGVNLEIKPCPGREVETAEVMLDIATRIWPDDLAPPLISSFQHVSLETALDMIPDWPRGLLLDTEHPPNWLEIAKYLKVSTLNINGNDITEEKLIDYMTLQKPVLAYTINSPEVAQDLLHLGIASVFSDCPDVIRDAIITLH